MKKLFTSLRIFSIAVLVLVIGFGGFYLYWNTASPQTTCTSCHEIESSSNMWAQSGHRNFHCRECHGTALSNGLHSLKEKGLMLVHHFTENEIRSLKLDEVQVLEIMSSCGRCHGSEYAKWTSGGHSATYASIFLNEKHNSVEQLHASCLRCHGMLYGGSIQDLVTPTSMKGPWTLKSAEQSLMPTIPCFACHKVHRQGVPAATADYSDPRLIFYRRRTGPPEALFYDRYEKTHIEAADLPLLQLWEGERRVKVANDPLGRICTQCHAPDAFHQAGTSDDRTSRGVHEGIGCMACHDSHSNESKQSCRNCHPAISNCQLDVTKMNTTFADSKSPHNIHFVRCIDCHTKGVPRKPIARASGN